MRSPIEQRMAETIEYIRAHNEYIQTRPTLPAEYKEKAAKETDRTCGILYAIGCYWSEEGTTLEQDQLLKEIGCRL